jgi:hypothetical protein
VLVLGQDPVPDRDGLVEGVDEFGLLGGFDDEQAGVKPSVSTSPQLSSAQPSRVTWCSSAASVGSGLWA